jgi:hypothetical protein
MSNHEDPPIPGGYRGAPDNIHMRSPGPGELKDIMKEYGDSARVGHLVYSYTNQCTYIHNLENRLTEANRFINDLNRLLEQYGYAQSTR